MSKASLSSNKRPRKLWWLIGLLLFALFAIMQMPAAWVLREATTNVLRHAQAGRVQIKLAPGTLIVVDDGVGPASRNASDFSPGNGLRGMAERAAAAGAELKVAHDAPDGTGTKVCLTW